MRVNMIPVIDYEEILGELEKNSIEEFFFYSYSDQLDGYFWVSTDEDAIPDLEQIIEDELEMAEKYYDGVINDEYINRIRTDIELITRLRAMGYDDGVLIFFWN
jgi:hypothetical protein